VVQALLLQRIREGLHDVLLPDHLAEGPGPVLPGKHEVRHATDSKGDLVPTSALLLAYNRR